MSTFLELGVESRILDAIAELGFEKPMPVQEKVIPVLLLEETDLVALAQTGTGKTAAFGIPIIQKLNYTNNNTEVLILCPTRELCLQITKDLTNYSKYIPQASITAVYGGASIENQKRDLRKGSKIIVATPGRMMDLMKRGYADISNVRWAILDEADEMLDMGFKDDLDGILSETPATKKTLLFSATMPKEVGTIARSYMENPVEITIGVRNSGSANVKHYYYLAHAKDRYLVLKRIADYYPDIYSIIFCRTRNETQEVADALIKDGYNADALHGDLSQVQREHVMKRFRCRNLQMLVATDVAARGLDVNDLTHVINYNLPDDIELYNHRSGRTGRADKSGISVSILNLREKGKLKQIERVLGKTFIQAKVPTGKEVCEKQLFHMIDKIENINVNYHEIDGFLPEIFKKLEWIDKEDLIRRFVSAEFNRFLDYYRFAPDLNVDEKSEAKKEGTNRRERERERNSGKSDRNYSRLFFSLGHRDKIVPQRLIGLINDQTQNRDINIGRIDIMDAFSYIDIGNQYVDEVIEAFDGISYKGRPLTVELAKPVGMRGSGKSRDKSYGRDERDRSRSSSSDKKYYSENKSFSNDRKRQGKDKSSSTRERKRR